ncbi:LAMI_0A01398g1_1 [Lachancea mirantina]|uniref:GID complex catalytic subunit 2 n=1 Tax=Lachancea mirantina TaxID=1230905 RepID=A0A1G4IMA8_9SACH|nr:LAMI_0A01398g1_1 [Lachancea mirantina]
MSELLKTLEAEFSKIKDAESMSDSPLKKCLTETSEFKMNLKKLRAHLTKQIQEEADSENADKLARKRQLIIEKLHKNYRQWEHGVRKQGKVAFQQHNKFNKVILNKIYDFDLDDVYVNPLPPNAREYVEQAVGLHISRYNMSSVPVEDGSDMVDYLENVYKVDPLISKKFVDMAQIIRELRAGNLESCMAWCTEGSLLEFELHMLKAMYFLQSGDKIKAFNYVLNSIPGFLKKTKKHHLRHKVAPLLAQLVVCSQTTFDISNQREKCINLFTQDYCARNKLSFNSSLFLIVMSGIISFQFFIKYRTIRAASHVDWSTENELPFNVKLPDFLTKFHPIFICPVLKEETTTENPPYALPCHHIISKVSLDKLSKNGTCNFKCPYCPIMAARSRAEKVSFVFL